MLELEVTETIALHDDDRSVEVMTAMRDIGVGIAFDDFGTGFASLSSLQRYPLTTLKIDRGFIANIIDRPGDAAITRALVMLSKELGLDLIAEGVETEEQEQALMALGCPSAQGYRYGRPMPAADLERLSTQGARLDERAVG
jgi:EAL domain-containing protein (putative c-di-GMP-specific phosphodiesterase class I)